MLSGSSHDKQYFGEPYAHRQGQGCNFTWYYWQFASSPHFISTQLYVARKVADVLVRMY